ncbi:MAG TPA: hypothetical protein PKE07_00730 [Lacibacter sp.]|nr:hypothetical protein [Lacibacter sp.]HMO88177.1 hypothetical protein [Lacibacter sp.]
MKLTLFIILASLLLLTNESCKKKDSVNVEGYWVGKWGFGTGSPNENMAVIFRKNGTVRVLYGYVTDTSTAGFRFEDTYSISDSELRFSYVETGKRFIHVAKPSNKRLEGTWGQSPSTTNGGLYFLDKR